MYNIKAVTFIKIGLGQGQGLGGLAWGRFKITQIFYAKTG